MTLPSNEELVKLLEEYAAENPVGILPQQPIEFLPNLPIHPVDQAAILLPDEEWDYTTATVDRDGEPLPEGAAGFTPNGEVYWGTESALGEWWAAMVYNLFQKPTGSFTEDVAEIIEKRPSPTKESTVLERFKISFAQTIGLAEITTSAISAFFRELTGIGTDPITPGERLESEDVGEKLKGGAQVVGRAIGQIPGGIMSALQDLEDITEVSLFGTQKFLSELAEEAGEPIIPSVGQDIRIQNPDNFWGDSFNWFAEMVDAIDPKNVFTDVVNIMGGIVRGDISLTPGEFISGLTEEMQAARIAYSAWVDPAIRDEFMRRFRAGENPYLLAQELENPVAELAGGLIFDPLNFVGVSKTAKLMDDIGEAERLVTTVPEVAKVLDGINLSDEALMAGKLDDTIQAISKYADESRDAATALARDDAFRAATTGAKAARETTRFGNFIGGLSRSAAFQLPNGSFDTDKFLDVLRDMSRLVGKNATESERAEALMKLGRSGFPVNVLLSDDGFRAGILMDEMLTNMPKLADDLKGFEDADDLLRAYSPILEKTIENIYPTLKTRITAINKAEELTKAGKKIPDGVQKLVDIGVDGDLRIVRALTNASSSPFVRIPNQFYSYMYMGLSGGYVFKNIFNNTFTTFIDSGFRAFITEGKLNIDFNVLDMFRGKTSNFASSQIGYLKAVYGTVPAKATSGIGAVGGLTSDVFEGPAKWKKIFDRGLVAAQTSERAASVRIYAHTTREVFDVMLKEGRVIGDLGPLKAIGMTEDQASMLIDLTRFHNGDIPKTMAALEETTGIGAIDSYKHLLAMDAEELNTLAQHGFLEIFQEAAKMDDPAKAQKFIADKINDLENYAKQGTAAIVPGIEKGSSQSRVAKAMDGHIADDARHLHNARVTANQASDKAFLQMRDEIVDLVGRDAIDDLIKLEPKIADNKGAIEMLFEIGTLDEDGLQFGAVYGMFDGPALRFMDSTVAKWDEFIKASPGEDMVAWWNHFGIAGDPPPGLSKQMLADILWDEHYERVSRMFWNGRRETIFELTNKTLEALQGANIGFIPPKSLVEGIANLQDARNWQNAIFDSVNANRQMQAWFIRGSDGVAIKNDFDYITQLGRRNGLYELKGNINVGAYPNVNNQTALRNALREVEGAEDVKSVKDFLAKGFSREDAIKAIEKVQGEKFVPYTDELTDAFGIAKDVEKAEDVVDVTKPITEMTIEEFQTAKKAAKGSEKSVEVQLFGEAGAKRYDEAQRTVNQAFVVDDDAEKAAQAVIDRMEASLSDTERDLLFGVGEQGFGPEEFRVFDNAFRNLSGDTDAELITTIRRRITKLNVNELAEVGDINKLNTEQQAIFLEIRNAMQELGSRGADDVVERIFTELAENIGAEDALFIKGRFEEAFAKGALQPKQLERAIPILNENDIMNDARSLHEAIQGGLRTKLEEYSNKFIGSWGKSVPVDFSPQLNKAIGTWAEEASKRADIMRATAIKVADARRDFALLDYTDKRNFDLALGLIFPYQFWHGRTYVNWARRIAQNPKILSRYAAYRRTLEKIHSELPEWWRYQINTNELLGLDSENPIYFNLEATLNPLYQLTGVPFDDPKRRASWFTTVLDGLNKVGPSTWSPLSIIAAIEMMQKGETEAAARWGSNLISPLKTIEAIGSILGDNMLGNALQTIGRSDPGTYFFSGGVDPYVRNRIGRALGAMMEDETITQDQAIEAARAQEGAIWEEAHDRAVRERAPGQLTSAFLGVGFKGRSIHDIQIDKFYDEFFLLMNMRHNLSPSEFQSEMANLREKHPFMDTVLLAKKGGDERDVGFAYNVLARIPPGASGIYELVGLSKELINKFYDSKGQFGGNEVDGLKPWTGAERTEFMDGIIQLGAILETPDDATREEWNQAKLESRQLNEQIEFFFGEEIREELDLFWDIRNEKGDDAAFDYLDLHPNVKQAMDYRDNVIVNNPETMLATYYSSIRKINSYYQGIIYTEGRKRFGNDIFDLQEEYFALKSPDGKTTSASRAFLKANPQIIEYWDYSRLVREQAQAMIDSIAPLLGTGAGIQIREGAVVPEEFSAGIETQQQSSAALEAVQRLGGSALIREVKNSLKFGNPLDATARQLLSEIAASMGISLNILLSLLGSAI